jgi:hypothetical protein
VVDENPLLAFSITSAGPSALEETIVALRELAGSVVDELLEEANS